MNIKHFIQQSTNNIPSAIKRNQFDELLQCFICLEKLQQPHICPCCSKLCCYTCITKWLADKQFCPHCRSSLRITQLVNCRFLEDIGNAISTIDPCPQHSNQSLSYYCLTCSLPICSDCAMFEKHKQHDYERIQNVYDVKVRDIMEGIDKVNLQLKSYREQSIKLDDLVDLLNRSKDERVQEIQSYSDNLLSKLESIHQQRLLLLFQQKQKIATMMQQVSQGQEELVWQIKNFQKSQLIDHGDDMLEKVNEMNNRQPLNVDFGMVNLDFKSEIVPSYQGSEFILKNYQLYKSESVVYSDPLLINGVQWRLKVYPQGNGNAKGIHLSVFLEMGQIENQNEGRKYEYKVEMISENGQIVVREFSSEFESGECWGYNRFMRIEQLEKDGFLRQDDSIVFKYYVRCPTFVQQCEDQQRYIKQLENQQQNVNKNLREQEQKFLNIENSQENDQEQEQDQDDMVSCQSSKGIEDWIMRGGEKSSIAKLKEEIEQYAEKLEQLEQSQDDDISNDDSSSDKQFDTYQEGLLEEIFANTSQTINNSQQGQVRRNLITNFEQEAQQQEKRPSTLKENRSMKV